MLKERNYYRLLMGSSVHGFDIGGSDKDYVYLYVPTLSELLDNQHKLSYETEVFGNKVTVRDLRSLINNLDKCDVNDLQLLYQMGNINDLEWLYNLKEELIRNNKDNIVKRVLGYSNNILKNYTKAEDYGFKVKEYFRLRHLYSVLNSVAEDRLETLTFKGLGKERELMLEAINTNLDDDFNKLYNNLEVLANSIKENFTRALDINYYRNLGLQELEKLVLKLTNS